MSRHSYPFRVFKDGAIVGEFKTFLMAVEIANEHEGATIVNLDDLEANSPNPATRAGMPAREPPVRSKADLGPPLPFPGDTP